MKILKLDSSEKYCNNYMKYKTHKICIYNFVLIKMTQFTFYTYLKLELNAIVMTKL